MSDYPFQILTRPGAGKELLGQRPLAVQARSYADNAMRFVPGSALENAIHAATALGVPLFLSGEAGTGKTQTAYYVAHHLGLEPVLHFQVKSDSRAQDLLYRFDAERYRQDLQFKPEDTAAHKARYINPGPLWQAFGSKEPRVLLIDEIDKAPRDFPNDLLHELEKLEFRIPELGKTLSAPPARRPLLFITSNRETLLPDPFLRRCMHYHIQLDRTLVETVVERHREDFAGLAPEVVQTALERFFELRRQELLKAPGLAELLLWLRLLYLADGTYEQPLSEEPAHLPFLGMLIKHPEDLEALYRFSEKDLKVY